MKLPIVIFMILLSSCTKKNSTENANFSQRTPEHASVDANHLRRLLEKSNDDAEALSELCGYVVKEDLISLGDFKIDDDLKSLCAEKRK